MRATNTISSSVVTQLRTMNEATNHVLVKFPESGDLASSKSNTKSIRAIFTELYYDATIGNDKLSGAPEISLDQSCLFMKHI